LAAPSKKNSPFMLLTGVDAENNFAPANEKTAALILLFS
jgi:hypothetical protein